MDKNCISNSVINTGGGDFINGDNNFIQKVVFNLSYNEVKIKSIVKQTKNVLHKIQGDISGHHLRRNLSDLPIQDIISNNQFIFINGEAGSGKSAYAKHILESLDETCVIAFAADQFLKSSLINTLHEINIDLSIEEIFTEFEEFPNKIIYIDSFEKLLEGDAESFRELISILERNKDIKLIVSCRNYALEILKFNYFDKQLLQGNSFIINVPQLNDEELEYFKKSIPALSSLIQNENLTSVIRVPKYLSLAEKLVAFSNEDLSSISSIEFKKQLWKSVVGGSNALIEEHRQSTFVEITIKRAKNLTLLTTVSEFNSDIVYKLKSDGILFEENNLYAPSHDIFEDWGLIRYIDSLKINNPKLNLFYNSLTNEPAIRRGFRLWVESKIEESESWIYQFVIDTIDNSSIENHWKDEVLIAIIKSDLCDKFFIEHTSNLLEDDLNLLKKIIHLLKISGKDFNQAPNHKGWDIVIKFLYENTNKLSKIFKQILRLLYDWERILYFGVLTNKQTAQYAGKLLTQILKYFEENPDQIDYEETNSLLHNGIKLQYQLAEYIPKEIKVLLDNLLIKTDKADYQRKDTKRKQIEYALSYFYSGTLPEFFPDELIKLANLKWKLRKQKKDEFRHHSRYGVEHYFGLVEKYELKYFPHSAYQTFFHKLIRFHLVKALDFIIEFTNYCAENYVGSKFLKDEGFGRAPDDISKVEVLYNEQSYFVYGSSYLWLVNRGGQITVPDLLQSLVVSLERYLYEVGQIETDKAEEIIQLVFNRIYTKVNSVILISVLSSIAMAFPRKVGNKLLPLISEELFFHWDRNRWIHEDSSGSLLNLPTGTSEGQLCNNERKDAQKWEHRKKYDRGLTGFLIQYQLFYGNLDGKVFEMIDRLENKKVDIYSQKLLSEIDVRKQRIEEVDNEGQKVIQIEPNYSVDSSLEEMMQINEKQIESQNQHAKHSLWVSRAYKNESKENLNYKRWKEAFDYYQTHNPAVIEFFSAFPIGTLAVLGLDFFDKEIDDREFNFCVDTILDIAKKLYQSKKKEFSDLEGLDFSISIYDYDSVYASLPKLISYSDRIEESQLSEIKLLILLFLRDLHSEHDIHLKHFYESFRKYVWGLDYQFAYNCFIGLVLYAGFFEKYPNYKSYSDIERRVIQDEESQILKFIEENKTEKTLNNLSYLKFSHWYLDKALHVFPIYDEFSFSYDFLKLIFSAHVESYYIERRRSSSSVEYHQIGNTLRDVIVDFLFEVPFNENTKSYFEFIIDKGSNQLLENRKGYDSIDYIRSIIEWCYYKVDSNFGNEKMLNNLWLYWNDLYQYSKNKSKLFVDQFLFKGNYWNTDADDWFVLKGNNVSSIYLKKLETLDYLNTDSLLQLLSGIGFQNLMPQGIKVLTKHLKSDVALSFNVNYHYGEKLLMRCFTSKMKQIKEDTLLMDKFLWFLNLMIIKGSSKAYYVRENLILYKRKIA